MRWLILFIAFLLSGSQSVLTTPTPAWEQAAANLYNLENRLITRSGGSSAIELVYDGDGNRVRKKVGAAETWYLVDDRNPTGYAQVIEERSTLSGPPNLTVQPTVAYVYGLDLVSQNRAGTIHFFGYDGLGSVRYLTTGASPLRVDATYTYDSFGILIARHARRTSDNVMVPFTDLTSDTAPAGTAPVANAYRYTGEQWDADLGMYYLRARYYHPDLGRFWTMDTFEGSQNDPLSLHKYLYCAADPVNRIDPSGREYTILGINASTALRTTLFTLNAVGAISNAKQTARYSVSAFEAISNDDPWNAALAAAGAAMHGGLTAANVLGMKSFMSSLPPPPAAGVAIAGGGVAGIWQFALSNPLAKKWVFEEFVPVAGTALGLFVSNMGHEAQWEHRDSGGRIKTRGETESGSEGAPTGLLNFNQQLQTHSEWKLLSELTGLKPGDIITIRGQFPPCDPGGRGCYSVMQEFAKRNQVKVIYRMEGGPTWVLE